MAVPLNPAAQFIREQSGWTVTQLSPGQPAKNTRRPRGACTKYYPSGGISMIIPEEDTVTEYRGRMASPETA